MIKINVYLVQSLIHDELILKDRNIVVIDALRATSTIHTALENSAKEVIPTENTMVAARAARGLGNSLLCGERNGKIIEGFNLGNSPFEYTENIIKGKSLVFATTNGATAIVKSKFAKNSIISSFLNLSAVVHYLIELNEDADIICSGKLNDYCIEDSLTAGLIIYKIIELKGKNYIELDDSGYCCYQLAKSLVIRNKDIDKYSTLPLYKHNVIKLKDKFETEEAEKSKMKRVNISNKLNPKVINESKKQK